MPEPLTSPAQAPLQDKSYLEVDKSSKVPDVKLQVKDPYDELLSMILDGSTGLDFPRLSPVDSPAAKPTGESQSRFKPKAEGSQPDVKPAAVTPARCTAKRSAGDRLAVQFHRPVAMDPIAWGAQSKTVNEPQRPPSMKGRGYTELFIEEDDDAREDRGEDVDGLNGGLGPQVCQHGVSCTAPGSQMEGNAINLRKKTPTPAFSLTQR